VTEKTAPLAAPSQAQPGRASGALAGWRRTSRRVWPWVAVAVGAVLWWPAGFWGLESWPRLPLRPLDGDLLLLGATAAAASVSLVVRSPWPRFVIVIGWSALGWLVSAPSHDTYPDERQSLALILAGSAFVGIVLGARGHKGPLGAAGVLAFVAGFSPATWPHGAPLAVALALPFAVASWHRVAPTVLSVLRVLVTWLVAGLLAAACRYGWDVLHPQMNIGSRRGEARVVANACWDFVRTQWWTSSEAMLRAQAGWFWVAAALAVAIAAARALTSGGRRRSRAAPRSRPGS
jgi:hypothetical protein